jgi:hypothetical protein
MAWLGAEQQFSAIIEMRRGQVASSDYLSEAPTDPDVQIFGIWLVESGQDD